MVCFLYLICMFSISQFSNLMTWHVSSCHFLRRSAFSYRHLNHQCSLCFLKITRGTFQNVRNTSSSDNSQRLVEHKMWSKMRKQTDLMVLLHQCMLGEFFHTQHNQHSPQPIPVKLDRCLKTGLIMFMFDHRKFNYFRCKTENYYCY